MLNGGFIKFGRGARLNSASRDRDIVFSIINKMLKSYQELILPRKYIIQARELISSSITNDSYEYFVEKFGKFNLKRPCSGFGGLHQEDVEIFVAAFLSQGLKYGEDFSFQPEDEVDLTHWGFDYRISEKADKALEIASMYSAYSAEIWPRIDVTYRALSKGLKHYKYEDQAKIVLFTSIAWHQLERQIEGEIFCKKCEKEYRRGERKLDLASALKMSFYINSRLSMTRDGKIVITVSKKCARCGSKISVKKSVELPKILRNGYIVKYRNPLSRKVEL